MSRQRGVALLTALVLVALATVLAVTIGFDSAMAARRSTATLGMEQGVQLAQGAEAGAAMVLKQDNKRVDSLDEPWAQPFPAVEVVPEIGLEAQMLDEQRKFNLNTLVRQDGSPNTDAVAVFRRLLELLDMDLRYADLLVDWLDPDLNPQSLGGEDSLYLSQNPAGRAANLPITSVSELEQLPGFGRANYLKLQPHVTALPPNVATINTCTADRYVLDAVFALSKLQPNKQEYTLMTEAALLQAREKSCFPEKAVFVGGESAELGPHVDVTSSYFQLRTWVRIGPARFTLYSLMYRDANGDVRPIGRTFGTD